MVAQEMKEQPENGSSFPIEAKLVWRAPHLTVATVHTDSALLKPSAETEGSPPGFGHPS